LRPLCCACKDQQDDAKQWARAHGLLIGLAAPAVISVLQVQIGRMTFHDQVLPTDVHATSQQTWRGDELLRQSLLGECLAGSGCAWNPDACLTALLY